MTDVGANRIKVSGHHENGPADCDLINSVLSFRASQAQTRTIYRFSVWTLVVSEMMYQGHPPSHALKTKKRKLNGRN